MPDGTPFYEADLTPEFGLGPVLSPLEAYKDRMLILDGIENENAVQTWGVRGYSHGSMVALLTGRRLPTGPFTEYGNVEGPWGWPEAASVDQVIADASQGETSIRSLNLGVGIRTHIENYPNLVRWIHRGPSQPVDLQPDPYAAFDGVFSGLDLDIASRERLAQRREAVLQVVGRDLERVRGKLPADDRLKIERHSSHLEELTTLLTTYVGEGCDPVAPEAGFDPFSYSYLPEIGRAHRGIVASALACDVTRVASVILVPESASHPLPFLDAPGATDTQVHTHHDRSHDYGLDKKIYAEMWAWYMEELAGFLELLDSYPEGDGTLLDNTQVMVCAGIGESGAHAHRNLPIALFGGGAGFRMGRYLRWGRHAGGNEDGGGKPINDLFVSLCQGFGLEIDTFGDPDLCNGPLPNLT
jgi:hypothetical protein